MKCIHCKAELVAHEGLNAKRGALHCYECGCCFNADGKTPREGVAVCALAGVKAEASATSEKEPVPVDDDDGEEEEGSSSSSSTRRRRGQ